MLFNFKTIPENSVILEFSEEIDINLYKLSTNINDYINNILWNVYYEEYNIVYNSPITSTILLNFKNDIIAYANYNNIKLELNKKTKIKDFRFRYYFIMDEDNKNNIFKIANNNYLNTAYIKPFNLLNNKIFPHSLLFFNKIKANIIVYNKKCNICNLKLLNNICAYCNPKDFYKTIKFKKFENNNITINDIFRFELRKFKIFCEKCEKKKNNTKKIKECKHLFNSGNNKKINISLL